MDDRTEKPVVASWARTHEFQSSFSHEKTKHVILEEEEETHDRTETPVVCPQRGAQQLIIRDDETESELSLGSRSFLNRVNDQVRKRQKQSSIDATEDSEEHSVIWGMFMSSTLQASVFMGKNYSDNQHSINYTKDLTMKQMFDTSAQLVSEQDEIYGVKTINWEDYSWKYLSLIGDEQVISILHTKVLVFSDSVSCHGPTCLNARSNTAWEQRLAWFKSSLEYRTLNGIDREPMEFEGNIFPGFTTLQPSHKVQELLLRLGEKPENFTGRIIFVSMFNDISWDQKTTRKNASQMLNSFVYLQKKDLEQDKCHSSDLDQRNR